MGEDGIFYGGASAAPKPPEPPKTNETRIVEALESIASELFHIRQQLQAVTDGGDRWGDPLGAIRTTGR